MSFLFRSLPVVALLLIPVSVVASGLLLGEARAAASPGSIMPQQGAAYDDLVNQTPPYPSSAQEGRDGYIGTRVDPATGDVITDVVSPRMPQQQQQQVPIYIQPRIDGYGVDAYPDMQPGYRPGGHQGGHWQQGQHRPQRQHGHQQYGNGGHGSPQHGFSVTHPGQAPSGHPGGPSAGGMRPPQVPHVSGNSVQHPGYSQFGGNLGNMGNYMPQGRR